MAKYLRKKEFRYDENPKFKNRDGKGHVAYMTVRYRDRAKVNLITHSENTFFDKPTQRLSHSPKVNDKDPRPSRVSVPYWENVRYLQKKPYGKWRLSKKDQTLIRKINRQAAKEDRKKK